MKKGKYVILVLMLVGIPLMGIQVIAHPPENMVLEYDVNIMTLSVTITHIVSNPDDHYIYKVEFRKNNELIQTENYDSQPTTSTFTYTYSIDAQGGDVLEVTAFCSIAGSITREITVPYDGDNNPPNKPDINGPASGKINTDHEYTFIATDPDGDDIFYCIDWGDNSEEVCIGPFPSGEEQKSSHSWSQQGQYTIKIKARDIKNAESDWATFSVNMPKNKPFTSFISRFFECYVNIFQTLRSYFGLF